MTEKCNASAPMVRTSHLWILAATLFMLVASKTLANCFDPDCGDFYNAPNCSASGCAGPIIEGTGFDCCCTNGNSGCCEYICSQLACTTTTSSCPPGAHGVSGYRVNPGYCWSIGVCFSYPEG